MKLFILSTVLIGSLSTTMTAHADNETAETVRGYMPKPDMVQILVDSGGCTKKEDFRVVANLSDDQKVITIFRTRPDICLPFLPASATLNFSHQELGLQSGDHFRIANPVGESVVW